MRLICISDLHGNFPKTIPDGDVLVNAGDITMSGGLKELKRFDDWVGTLPHKHKITICGNHDWCFERQPEASRQTLTNCIYLEDEEITIDGVKFYGSPWQPEFFNWAFNLRRGRPLEIKWSEIPNDTDVLITHGPPYGILDITKRTAKNVGCEELTKRLKVVKPKVHVFGHIHEAYGEQHGTTSFINASLNDLSYNITHKPIVIDI